MTNALHIINPGPFATVQDLGRYHAFHLGVPVSGALDPYAHQIANWLVGNSAHCATLELTMIGGCIKILAEFDLAVTGALMNLQINGVPKRQWQSIRVKAGDIVELGYAENGCRAYLAISGGIGVPMVLDSRSTYIGGAIGGYEGRALQAGDILARGKGPLLTTPRCLPWIPLYPETIFLRAIAGPHDDSFERNSASFFSTTYKVSNQTNRMGCRLAGLAIARDPGAPDSIISEPVTPGNIQIPADGQPIILLNEQTIGGYTCIATVITADLWRIAQAKPGTTVRFSHIFLDEAHQTYRQFNSFLQSAQQLLTGNPS